VQGLSPAEVGMQLGAALLIGSVAGMPLHGWLADRLFSSGRNDAHLRHMMVVGALGTPIGVAAFHVSDPTLCIALVGLFMCVISAYSSLPMVVLQLFVPGDLRGKAASTLLLINGVAGISLGPTAVALLTDLLFRDTAKVGVSVSICIGVFLPMAVVAFGFALKPLRHTLREVAAES
jgi:hypothetical protein